MAEQGKTSGDPVVIKKYANRRLYNTASSSYVTLDHLCQMVKNGVDFVVFDAKSGEDITRSVLTQIIFEEESKGQNMLPVNFLKKIIGFYGDSLQPMVPNYLEMTMDSFTRNQDQMRSQMRDSFGERFPMKEMEDIGRRNMAMFEQTMRMMNPFLAKESGGNSGKDTDQQSGERKAAPSNGEDKAPAAADSSTETVETLELLRRQMTEMQSQINKLAKG